MAADSGRCCHIRPLCLASERAWKPKCCWAQPDPPLSVIAPTKVENAAAREVADRPPKLADVAFIRLTLPFLSRSLFERVNETLRARQLMTSTNAQHSTGIEFSPAALSTARSYSGSFPFLGPDLWRVVGIPALAACPEWRPGHLAAWTVKQAASRNWTPTSTRSSVGVRSPLDMWSVIAGMRAESVAPTIQTVILARA